LIKIKLELRMRNYIPDTMRVGVEPRSRNCDHAITIKTALNPLGHAVDYYIGLPFLD